MKRKRHEALIPLSHHHHHALVEVVKLKRAGTAESKFTIEEIKASLRAFWYPGGNAHFREEEEILLPAFAKFETVDRPEIIENLLEHVKIRSLVSHVLETDGDPVPLMHELGKMLDAHIRKEERIIFPMIEDALSEETLQGLAPYFHGHGE